MKKICKIEVVTQLFQTLFNRQNNKKKNCAIICVLLSPSKNCIVLFITKCALVCSVIFEGRELKCIKVVRGRTKICATDCTFSCHLSVTNITFCASTDDVIKRVDSKIIRLL